MDFLIVGRIQEVLRREDKFETWKYYEIKNENEDRSQIILVSQVCFATIQKNS